MIEAFITNAGKYAEGELRGDWLRFPTTKEDVQALLSRIGVDGAQYQEYFITDYKTNLEGIHSFGEYESIDELNYLATLLSDMDDWELEKFEAAVTHGEYSGSVEGFINLTQNLDCYDILPGASDNEGLARYLIEEWGYEEIPERLEMYFNYDSYGQDFSLNENGEFAECGYILRNSGNFSKHYSGREDIPDEHRVFAYPPPPDRGLNVDNTKITQSTRIAENDYVKQLLEVMESNNMPGAKDLQAAVYQVTAMEKYLADMVSELGAMRRELAEAQRMNHPIQTALSKAVVTLQAQALDIRDKLSGLKQNIVVGCKNALEAFQEKGLSALRNIADFLKIRPALESLQKDIDKAIHQDNAAINRIEKISTEYHEAGRHLKNIGRAIAGKEAIQQANPPGRFAKALTASIRADRACCMAMRGCVGKAIGAVERLENTERKPPIKDTIERLNQEIAQAGREAPSLQRSVPEHTGR